MTYQLVSASRAQYSVDWDVVERLCRSYWTSVYQLQHADIVDTSQSSFYNPWSWSMPRIRTVEVAWDKVEQSAAMATLKDIYSYNWRAPREMFDIAREMELRVHSTRYNKRQFAEQLRDVQRVNIGELEQADESYSDTIEALRFVRDTSADVVAIGSTIATGGASVGMLGASSALKGWGKYQDTDSVGAAMVYGSGSLFLGAFKIGGAKLTTGAEYVLIIAQGSLETATSLVAGKSFISAIEAGGLKVASAGAAQALFGTERVKKIFERIPVPFTVMNLVARDGVNVMLHDMADKLLEKTAKKGTEYAVKAGLKALEKRMHGRGVAADAPLDDPMLLQLAIINMAKGLGNGF